MRFPQTNKTPIESTSIAALGYDEPTNVLEVEFQNGSFYQYFAVPRPLFERFIAAASKGRFFNKAIRNRYPCERVRPPR